MGQQPSDTGFLWTVADDPESSEVPAASVREERSTGSKIQKFIAPYKDSRHIRQNVMLHRQEHIDYLRRSLHHLGNGYQSLDASRPWMCYWILNSLDLLGGLQPSDFDHVAEFLAKCQAPTGGFGGGPGQLPHLAPTYAATNALAVMGPQYMAKVINRPAMYQFLKSMKTESGGFMLHKDGEADTRGVYCALSVASLLNIITPELTSNVSDFIKRCQTYEGGIGGEPGNEAHGGYSFCGLAALSMIDQAHHLDIPRLLEWAVFRQTKYGGFQGRTNKLVDGCYSFWVGGLFPLLQKIVQDHTGVKISSYLLDPSFPTAAVVNNPLNTSATKPRPDDLPLGMSGYRSSVQVEIEDAGDSDEETTVDEFDGTWLFNQRALQEYLLLCCQERGGGLRDKPSKGKDLYHTCYCLNGLSVAQHDDTGVPSVLGLNTNSVARLNPLYGLTKAKADFVLQYFKNTKDPFT